MVPFAGPGGRERKKRELECIQELTQGDAQGTTVVWCSTRVYLVMGPASFTHWPIIDPEMTSISHTVYPGFHDSL